MAQSELVSWTIDAGRWRGLVMSGDRPQIEIRSGDQTLGPVAIHPDGPGRWAVDVTIPAQAIAGGVHAFLVTDSTDDRRLGAFTITIGDVAGGDLVAEVAALRSEIELLKAAFRRQNRNG